MMLASVRPMLKYRLPADYINKPDWEVRCALQKLGMPLGSAIIERHTDPCVPESEQTVVRTVMLGVVEADDDADGEHGE